MAAIPDWPPEKSEEKTEDKNPALEIGDVISIVIPFTVAAYAASKNDFRQSRNQASDMREVEAVVENVATKETHPSTERGMPGLVYIYALRLLEEGGKYNEAMPSLKLSITAHEDHKEKVEPHPVAVRRMKREFS